MANLLFLVIVVVLYFLAYRRPGFACGYVLASYALEQCAQAFVPVAGINNSLCNFLIAGAVVVGIVGQILRSGLRIIKIRAPSFSVLVLIGYCYLTVMWSLFPSTTLRVLSASLPYVVVFVGLAPLLVTSTEDLTDVLTSLLWCSSISMALLLLFAEWGDRGVLLPFQGGESNPLAITEAAGALLVAFAFVPQVHNLKGWLRWLITATILGIVLLVFLRSASRGQIVAALGTVLAFSVLRKGARWLPVVLLVVAGLLSVGFLQEEVERNSFRWETDQVEGAVVSGRFGKVEKLLEIWSRSSPTHVVFGLGNATAQDPRLLGGYPHVVPAEVLAEEGLVGISIYLIAILTAARFLMKGYRAASEEFQRPIIAISALLTFEFLVTLKQGTIFGGAAFLLLLVLPGALSSTERPAD